MTTATAKKKTVSKKTVAKKTVAKKTVKKAVKKSTTQTKSDTHVAYAARLLDDSSGLKIRVIDDATALQRDPSDTYEFFLSEDNAILFWAKLDTVVMDCSNMKDFGKIRARYNATGSVVGAFNIVEALERMGASVPTELRDKARADEIERKSAESSSSMANKKTTTTRRGNGKSSGQGVAGTWADLLAKNEKAPKAKKMTDEQLVKAMETEFPDKKGKSTLTRISMVRGCYNKGTNMFKSFGVAKTPSVRYDGSGNAWTRATPNGTAKTASKKTASKKTAAKKTAAKKTVAKKKTASKKTGSKKTASKKVSKKG